MPDRLVLGYGYLGRRVAALWIERGDQVWAVTRSASRADQIRADGVTPIVADVTQCETLRGLPAVDTLLYAVGYDRTAEPSIHEVYAEGLRHTMQAVAATPRRVVYVSTTGVYGDAGGDWVDEQTPPAPAREGGAASLAAEGVLASGPWATRGVALRMAGLYGPGRLPYLDSLRRGEPIAAPRTGWLNLIHIDDAAAACDAAADAVSPPPVVCVVDDQPVERETYYASVAALLGAPPPTFTQPPPGSPRAARAGANKRVRNARLREALGVRLAYPTYTEGLRATLATEC